ncbi:mesoderm induction early response protein 1-like isoform X2 [Cloeon dipterum]|uniref:mesoderm induction early response protein 1-like isoform X2 n=1 Tax=Cloeon dipterum TaxID=197152 RepID=UPI0032206880
MAEANVGKNDKDFDPSVEMLVNDFDDEQTLEEEEAMEATEDTQKELCNLKEEGEMPLEQLMAMYGCYAGGGEPPAESSEEEEENDANEEENENEENVEEEASDSENNGKNYSELQKLYEDEAPAKKVPGTSKGTNSNDEEDEEDYDYSPEEDEWKKTIMVGTDYQASIPESLSKYGDALPYENEDKLLWDPMRLPEHEVTEYLRKAARPSSPLQTPGATPSTMGPLPLGAHLRDDENALYVLQQCSFDSSEALRRINLGAQPTSMDVWSEEECRNFENGIRIYGKDFYSIQAHRVKTRTVGELVQFYYLWKKTARHDMFAHKTRLEKKKYALHPGITDYMDRILDEQESSGQTRDRSLSPKSSCLLLGDQKRRGGEGAAQAAESGAGAHTHTLLSSLNHRHQEAVDAYLKDKEADFSSSTNSITQVQ